MPIWKDIKGYEGLYQVSDIGDVIGLKFNKVLSPRLTKKGYNRVALYKKGNPKNILVHRLVGEAFLGLDIGNKNICVCHKDDNPLNNKLNNLFLGTRFDNMQDMVNKGRHHHTGKRGKKSYLSKKIKQLDILGNSIKTWHGIQNASRELGIDASSICACCKGKLKTAGGFIFKYI